jgi:hypothetical protein
MKCVLTGLAGLALLFAATQASEWVRRYDGGAADSVSAIALSPSGSVYVVGRMAAADTSTDFLLIRDNAASGDSVVQTYRFHPGPDGTLPIFRDARFCL